MLAEIKAVAVGEFTQTEQIDIGKQGMQGRRPSVIGLDPLRYSSLVIADTDDSVGQLQGPGKSLIQPGRDGRCAGKANSLS